jgi:hypothetical protein
LKGTRVKGQHQPDLMVEEAQDYPEPGWIEVHETVMKDRDDFQYHFYGVHSGNRASTFYRHTSSGNFEIIQVTAIMRPGWSKAEKETAKSIYGGTSSPDYRRNILGEPGSAASAYFVLARLFACMDQDRESEYNTLEYASQELAAEDIDELLNEADRGDQGALTKIMMNVMDLPTGHRAVWGGMDVGLAQSPTVISLWAQKQVNKIERLSLFRRFTLSRLRTNQILAAWAAIGKTYGNNLRGFGIDSTGLGFPILQQMQDARAGEEVGQVPQHLIDVTRGYFFNAKVPVDVNKEQVTDDGRGNLRDGFGNIVKEEVDPFTGEKRYVTMMPMIEASTRYLRDFVDDTYLRLPFDPEVARDMQAETKQRVERLAGVKTKPDAFHILDSFRAMAMVFKAERIEAGAQVGRARGRARHGALGVGPSDGRCSLTGHANQSASPHPRGLHAGAELGRPRLPERPVAAVRARPHRRGPEPRRQASAGLSWRRVRSAPTSTPSTCARPPTACRSLPARRAYQPAATAYRSYAIQVILKSS